MGIKGLKKVLKKNGYEPKSLNTKNFLKESENKEIVVGIDTSIYLYRYKNIFNENYLFGFIGQLTYFLSNNILPIYVFDGKATMEKEGVLEERKETYEKNQKYVDELEMEMINTEEEDMEKILELQEKIEKKKSGMTKITKDVVENVKKLLDYMGIYYYEYDGEADLFCRYLFEKDLIDYVITEDMDLLTHGCKKVLTGFNTSNKPFEIYEMEKILETMGITQKQFIDICILLGCDYTGTVNGIGPVSSVKFIKKYGNIEKMIKQQKSFSYETMDYKSSRKMFTIEVESTKKITRKKIKPKYKKNKIEEMKTFLNKFNITDKKINKMIDEYKKFRKRSKQSLV